LWGVAWVKVDSIKTATNFIALNLGDAGWIVVNGRWIVRRGNKRLARAVARRPDPEAGSRSLKLFPPDP